MLPQSRFPLLQLLKIIPRLYIIIKHIPNNLVRHLRQHRLTKQVAKLRIIDINVLNIGSNPLRILLLNLVKINKVDNIARLPHPHPINQHHIIRIHDLHTLEARIATNSDNND